MRLRETLLAATIVAAPAAVMAQSADYQYQPVTGVYVGAGVGGSYLENTKIKQRSVTTFTGNTTQLGLNGGQFVNNWGFVGLASVGWGFGNGLRAEVEGNYRQYSLRKWTGTLFPTNAGGDNQTYGAMVNVLYDFDLQNLGVVSHDAFPLVPYLGAGVGYSETTLRGYKAFSNNASFNIHNQSDGEFGYQAIAGLAYPIAEVPGLAVTLEYRFYGALSGESFKTNATAFGVGGRGAGFAQGKIKIDDQLNHSVLLGVRYNFGVVPPPPPPVAAAPVQQPARSYLVFFDWDRADLTTRARQIIHEAADNSRRVQYTRIEVNGYTDTSGSPAYNQRLSVRRAQTVAAELVRDGVPRNAIAIQGFGQTHLLVPTADGVREPQNRRVEIIIR
jgi:outer membrane protein OmpA-like peptidoglycan-associated protein